MPKTYTGRRGMAFESLLNQVNVLYKARKIALINKRPTPVKVLKSKGTRVLSGFYESKSTVDYDGVYRGLPICFEAKSVKDNRFDLKNLHEHQLLYLQAAAKQEAICFLLIEFKQAHDVYFVPLSMIEHYVRRAREGGRKSISIDDMAVYAQLVKQTKRAPLDYLACVDEIAG